MWQLAYDHRQRRAPLLDVLGAYLGLPPTAVELEPGEHGRPRLATAIPGAPDFNWSHSGDRALIAIGRGIMPGVDLELLRERPRAVEIARRYFSAEEAAWLESLAAAQRSAAFLELWTAKEAVLKALGRGLAFGLHRLSIARTVDALQLRQLEGEQAADWQLRRLAIGPAHAAAIAWRGAPRQIRLWTLAGND